MDAAGFGPVSVERRPVGDTLKATAGGSTGGPAPCLVSSCSSPRAPIAPGRLCALRSG